MSTKLDGCCALITGASAGLGREFARQLAARAGSLVLVARRVERLEELRAEILARDPNIDVRVRRCDLSRRDEVDQLVQWLRTEAIDVDLLINNAGLGDRGLFASSEPRRDDEMLMVNVVALTALSRALLPPMIERKRGAIVNVSSSASFLPIPTFAVYAASKAYVTSFSEALRSELHGSGVTVHTICPGPVVTEFGDVAARAGETYDSGPKFTHVSAEQVVRESLHAIDHDTPLVIPGAFMKFGMAITRVIPLALLRIVGPRAAKRAAR